jgi:hypothetical protein
MLQHYFLPWIISQIVSIIILLLAFRRPVGARYTLMVLFFAAGLFNWYASLTTPEAYMMYAETAIPLYRIFIEGWFSRNIGWVIPVIATGQLLIGTGLLIGHRWLALACLGIILFLLAIAPLGIGSAFPFSITVSIAAYLVFRNNR